MRASVLRNPQLYIIFSITFMAVMGVASITPALPLMAEHFGVTPTAMSMAVTMFTLPGIGLTPVAGILADRYGRKAVLVPALLLFGVAGVLCGFATSFEMLLVFRFLQGMGASPLGALYTSLIGDIFPDPQDRTRAMGYTSGVVGIGTALFPLIGGGLAEIDWNWPFHLCVLAVLAALVSSKWLHAPRTGAPEKLSKYIASLAKLAWNPETRIFFALIFICFFIMYGPVITFFPILADDRFNSSTGRIGIVLSASSVGIIVISTQLLRLTNRFSYKKLLLFGGVFYMLSMGMIPFIKNQWLFVVPLFFFGTAHELCYPNLATQLISVAPGSRRAGLLALNGTLLRVTQTVAPVFFGLVLSLGGLDSVYFTGAFFGFLVIALGKLLMIKYKD